MTRRIGGELTTAALGALLGDRPGGARECAEPHDLALKDAADHLKRAAAALRSVEHPNPKRHFEIGRLHAQLQDVLVALQTIERWPS